MYQKRSHGILLLNLSNTQLALGEFSRALNSIQEGLILLKNDEVYFAKAKEQEFYIYFFSNKLEKASLILEDLSVARINDVHREEIVFLQSCMAFIKGDYYYVNDYLTGLTSVEKDKNGWNFSIKLLLIMSHMEIDKWKDVAMAELENLQRYANRSIDNDSVKHRSKLIVKLINAIQREGYNYNAVLLKEKKTIEELTTIESALPCVYKSPNLILFSQWLHAKIDRKPFVPVFDTRLKEGVK